MPEAPLLAVRGLDAFYGDFQALFSVAMEVARGEAVAVIGANGASCRVPRCPAASSKWPRSAAR